MSKWYGSVTNRIEENRMFCDEIKVGTGVTEYDWSDRHPYEVTEVIDQKHVKVRMMDHKGIGEPYSNEWELISNPKHSEVLLNKRGNYWYKVYVGSDGKKTYCRTNVSFGRAEYYYDYEF